MEAHENWQLGFSCHNSFAKASMPFSGNHGTDDNCGPWDTDVASSREHHGHTEVTTAGVASEQTEDVPCPCSEAAWHRNATIPGAALSYMGTD